MTLMKAFSVRASGLAISLIITMYHQGSNLGLVKIWSDGMVTSSMLGTDRK
jgi:hypothetical protein